MSALTVTHDAEDGNDVRGTQHGDGPRTVLRTYGLKWSAQLGAWYLPNSRAYGADMQTVDALVGALGDAGFDVSVDVAEVSVADAEQGCARLSADRAERLRSRAARLNARAEAARQVLDTIAPGRPILVGHHSEGRYRRDLSRADRAMRDCVDARAAPQAAERGAATAELSQHQRHPAARRYRVAGTAHRRHRQPAQRPGHGRLPPTPRRARD